MSTTTKFPSGFKRFDRLKMDMAADFKALEGTFAVIDLEGDDGCVTEAASEVDLLSIGRFAETVDNTGGAARAKKVEVLFHRQIECLKALNDVGSPVTTAHVGKPCYFAGNNTVTASPTTTSVAGIVWGFDGIYVLFEPASRFIPGEDDPDAGDVAITDTLSLFASTDVEGALAELGTNVAYVPVHVIDGLDIATGAKLVAFVDGAFTTPGTEFTNSKTAAVRWNNHATPGAVARNVPIPEDYSAGDDIILHAHVSKTGATVGDATKLTVGAFEHKPGALHDADADFGGDTTAVVGNATAKTVTEVTLTLALANLSASPTGLCLTIKPKAGTLGTDDLLLHECWLEVVRKNVAA